MPINELSSISCTQNLERMLSEFHFSWRILRESLNPLHSHRSVPEALLIA